MPSTPRERELRKALRALAPGLPLADAEVVLPAAGRRALRALAPGTAVWLTLVARVRHAHTDYDALLAEGYDRDSARHFTLDATNDVLTAWGCARRLDPSDDGDGTDAEAADGEPPGRNEPHAPALPLPAGDDAMADTPNTLQENAEKALRMKQAADAPGAPHRAGQERAAADADAGEGMPPQDNDTADHGRREHEGAARSGLDRSRRPR